MHHNVYNECRRIAVLMLSLHIESKLADTRRLRLAHVQLCHLNSLNMLFVAFPFAPNHAIVGTLLSQFFSPNPHTTEIKLEPIDTAPFSISLQKLRPGNRYLYRSIRISNMLTPVSALQLY
jgi:hypothetical protein